MSEIGRLWAGHLFGTNTGNVSAEFENDKNGLKGIIRFLDDRFGPVVYEVMGTFDGSNLVIGGDAKQAPVGVATGRVTVTGALTPEGYIHGKWQSTLGNGGPLALFPHDQPAQAPGNKGSPEQLHTARRTLGALRLYAQDIRDLINLLRRDFRVSRVVVTYRDRGGEISKYADEFELDFHRIGKLRYLRLSIQEPDAYGLNRLAIVEMDAEAENEIRVQGVQESWVAGKAEALASQLRQRERALATKFRKFGLNINAIIGLVVLVALPELPVFRRAVFIVLVVLIAAVLQGLHSRYVPNVLIHLSDRSIGILERAWPQLLSWLIAASAGVAAAVIYGFLKGEFPAPTKWVSALWG